MKKVIISSMLCIALLISGCSSNVKKSISDTKDGTNVIVKTDSLEASVEADIKTLPEEYPKKFLPISAEDNVVFVSNLTVNNNSSLILEVESKKNIDELHSYYLTYIGGNNLYSSKSQNSISIVGTLKENSKYTASIIGEYDDMAKVFKYSIIVSFNK
ncbi:MAG: hypothetical protein MUO60_12970 [Clostridiaceae bacterium]|nr:hypothetical protein [Clostridiaceae bacterium]